MQQVRLEIICRDWIDVLDHKVIASKLFNVMECLLERPYVGRSRVLDELLDEI